MGSVAGPESRSTRRRGDELRRAIFDAAFGQLLEVGYAKLTMDGVAAAAGTGKAALYRRWGSKDELVLDALQDALPSVADVPLTDNLRADLLALLRCMQDAFNRTHGTVFLAVAADAGSDSGIVRTLVNKRIVEPCQARVAEALRRAAERGEANPVVANELTAAIGPAMLVNECVTDTAPIPDGYVTSIVDKVILPLVTRA